MPSILISQKGSSLAEKAAIESLPIIEMRMKPPFLPLTALRIAGLARANKVRTIHTHTSHAHSLGLLVASLLKSNVRMVVSRRVLFPPKRNLISRRKYLARGIRYIAISQAVKEALVRIGLPEEDVSMVYSGIDVERFSRADSERAKQLADELRIPAGSVVVGSVGSLVPCKGHAVLIEAVGRLVKEIPNIVCLIVGEGSEKAHLESLIRRHALQRKVILAGQRKEIPELLSVMSVFVMPSLEEGLGLALLEAMAAGKPVIASGVGGIREVITHGESGLLVPPGDPETLARALIALFGDPARMSSVGFRAKNRVRECFSRESMVEGTLNVYRSLGR